MLRKSFLIAQISDLHVGDARFDAHLMRRVADMVNVADPDLLVVGGDLTTNGYPDEFEEALDHLSRIECPQRLIIPGNHDQRNVGNEVFEKMVGPRFTAETYGHRAEPTDALPDRIKVVSADSCKPDLNDGEVGRQNYHRIVEEFGGDHFFKIFVLHHHLIGIPGTGRERNIVWDAGDVLETLLAARVNISLSGHKHVPHIWRLEEMFIITSGTACTHRTRGFIPPSFNLIEVGEDMTRVSFAYPISGTTRDFVF
jgi:3',5'-cyclic AMP phosphodiesterase CpdA